jgi:CCR4-NOT transcription complex subunit 7/8
MFEIKNVWRKNFLSSIGRIKSLIKKNSCVAMDTEFPGIVSKNLTKLKKNEDRNYQTLKTNVELLNLIQIGFSFSTEVGQVSKSEGCWQFNFYFNLKDTMFAQDSIDLLSKAGVDFDKHQKNGIYIKEFSDFLFESGLIFNKKIKWISFHSGYDFGYLIKMLTKKNLPNKRKNFFYLLNCYFPCIYDIKYLSYFSERLCGSLNKLAERFCVTRTGQAHQAGSDSLLTLDVFFKFKFFYYNGKIGRKFHGALYGLGLESDFEFFFT